MRTSPPSVPLKEWLVRTRGAWEAPEDANRVLYQGLDDSEACNVGSGNSVELPLDPELLGTLCRRSRRRLRIIQSSCQVIMKIDRVQGILRLYGEEACIEAAKKQLANLGGPRKSVPVALWAELMRTRTLVSSSQAIVMRLQELSGCRIHIERTKHEVRIFGANNRVMVANALIEELAKQCIEEAVPLQSSTPLCTATLQELAHTFGVTLWLEEALIVVLGLQEKVDAAVKEVRKFVAHPEGYKLDVSKQDLAVISHVTPVLSSAESLASLGGEDLTDLAPNDDDETEEADPQEPASAAPTAGPAQPRSWAARKAVGRDLQLQGAPQQAAGKSAEDHCTCCPTCGIGRFCKSCGHPAHASAHASVSGAGSSRWQWGSRKEGGQGWQGAHLPYAGQRRPPLAPRSWAWQSGMAANFSVPEANCDWASSQQQELTAYYGTEGWGSELDKANSQTRGATYFGNNEAGRVDANGMVMGGMVPVCFPVSMVPGAMLAQAYSPGSTSSAPLRHIYMVPTFAPPGAD